MSSQSSGSLRVPRPGPRAASAHRLERWMERLQMATDVEDALRVVIDALSSSPPVGRGVLCTVDERKELGPGRSFEGPSAGDFPLPELELTGVARRAIREGGTVRQSGVTAGTLWAVPLKSADRIEAVVAAVGEPEGLGTLLVHAGLALGRERVRATEAARARETRELAEDLERAVEILDEIVREGGTGTVLRRVTSAIAGVPGIGRVSLWTLRAEDGRYVETVAPDNGGRDAFTLPEGAHRTEGFVEWSASFPRWGGCPWIPAGTIERVGPGSGDVLLLVLSGSKGPHPLGFVAVEVLRPLEDVEGVRRWTALARHALESRLRQGRSLQDLEDLREEKEQLAELHRMKSQFIAAVSHELRTPLTSISAYAETLRGEDMAGEPQTRDRFLRVIHDESRRLTRIVDDILDLATMDAGRLRMSCREVDVCDVVHDALDVIRPLALEKGVEVTTAADSPSPVHADPDLLKQLAVNLLENATKFSRSGGHVSVSVEADATAVRLVVEDDGPGIPTDKLDLVFERFYQVDGTNSRAHGGSGLGLAICRNIASWHDGRIWAESDEGKGARFVVSLPRVRATSRSRTRTAEAGAVPDHRIPELLIEMIAEVMRARTVSLMLLEPSGRDLFVQAALGLPDDAIRDARVALGAHIAGRVAESGEPLLIADLDRDDRFDPDDRTDRREQYRSRSVLSVPVVLRGSVIGVLNVTNPIAAGSFSERDLHLLEILSQRVALVLSKLRELGDSRDHVHRIENAIRGVIDVRRHYHTAADSFSEVVLGICARLGLDATTSARVHYASILRDVGMTLIPEGAYKKPSALSDRDRELIRTHPEEGARMLRSIEFLPDIFDIILAHHEEPGGTGYPRGLTSEVIPLGAKILAVADAYDALRVGRPYRKGVSVEEAIEELRRHEGRQFDPQVVQALVDVVEAKRVTPHAD